MYTKITKSMLAYFEIFFGYKVWRVSFLIKRDLSLFMLFGTKRGLFELIFEFLKKFKMELESGLQSMEGQFSDKNGFEPFLCFLVQKGVFLSSFLSF